MRLDDDETGGVRRPERIIQTYRDIPMGHRDDKSADLAELRAATDELLEDGRVRNEVFNAAKRSAEECIQAIAAAKAGRAEAAQKYGEAVLDPTRADAPGLADTAKGQAGRLADLQAKLPKLIAAAEKAAASVGELRERQMRLTERAMAARPRLDKIQHDLGAGPHAMGGYLAIQMDKLRRAGARWLEPAAAEAGA